MKNSIFILIIIVIVTMGCSNSHEDDLINGPIQEETITYNGHVKQIISNNCLSCHSNPPTNGASVPLNTYNSLRSAVLNNALIDRINSNVPGYSMPFNAPKLPQNLIDIIEQWETDGFIEN